MAGMKRTWPVLGCVLVLFAALAPIVPLAQVVESSRIEAVNLSKSGAASGLVAVRGNRQNVQFFWWDRFDGLTTALYYSGRWSAPRVAPIMVSTIEMIERRETLVWRPIDVMPMITGDPRGHLGGHAAGARGGDVRL